MSDFPQFTGNFFLLLSILNRAKYDAIIEIDDDGGNVSQPIRFDIRKGVGELKFSDLQKSGRNDIPENGHRT